MPVVRLAYRDEDRTPVIFCIKEMAQRHYGVDVEVIVINEHLEYLYAAATRREKVTMFCAPSLARGLELVVPNEVSDVEALRGASLAVRTSGRPHAILLWL